MANGFKNEFEKIKARLSVLELVVEKLNNDSDDDYQNQFFIGEDLSFLRCYVYSLEKLQEVRHFLRKRLGSWNDTKTGMFISHAGRVFCTFERRFNSFLIHINLVMPVDEFPKNLLPSESCEIKKVQKRVTEYELSCPVKE